MEDSILASNQSTSIWKRVCDYFMQLQVDDSTSCDVSSPNSENNNMKLSMDEKKQKVQIKKVEINALPYHILLKVFSFLTLEDRVLDACFVCKYWYEICFDGYFWQDIDFEDRKHLSDEILLRSIKCSSNVTSLNLCDCYSKELTKEGIVAATKLCPNLKSLNLKGSISRDIGDEAMIAISENCRKLEHIEADAQSLSDLAIVLGFAENLHNLEHLNINQNRKVTDEGIKALIKSCPNLRKLKVNQIEHVTDECIEVLAEREKTCPRMESLSISMTGVTGTGTRAISHFKNLTFLDLTKCRELDEFDVEIIVTKTTKLTHFYVAMLNSFNDRCVELSVMHLKKLIEVYFGSTTLTDKAMKYMAEQGKTLERIDVPYSSVTHKGAETVCVHLPKLKRLGLTRCDKADEEELEKLVLRFPKISFSTFLQDAKRMLIRSGQWNPDDNEIVTQQRIMEKLHSSKPRPREKPRRVIASGGKIEYVRY